MTGANVIYGTMNDDNLVGTSYSDTIYTFNGNDTVYAHKGDDLIVDYDTNGTEGFVKNVFLGAGNDVVFSTSPSSIGNYFGGSGNDVFDFNFKPDTVVNGGRDEDTVNLDLDSLPVCEQDNVCITQHGHTTYVDVADLGIHMTLKHVEHVNLVHFNAPTPEPW